jgi:transposase
MDQSEVVTVGIDVSARELVVAYRLPGKKPADRKYPNTASGHRELVAFLIRHGVPVRACLEWTGTYSLDLAIALAGAPQAEVMVANPRMTKKFVEASGVRAKTDRVDAHALLDFGERMPFVPWAPTRPVVLELRALVRRIHDLTVARTREKNRLAAAEATATTPRSVRKDIEDTIEWLDERIKKLAAEACRIAKADAEFLEHVENLSSIQGVGEATAVAVLAELAVLPTDMRPEQVVAYAGLDPRTRESGTSVRGRGAISKRGNARLRAALFMPAMACVRFEPAIKEFYDRLLARNKPKKAALTAVMRRLLAVMWTLLRTKQRFDADRFRPKQRAAA